MRQMGNLAACTKFTIVALPDLTLPPLTLPPLPPSTLAPSRFRRIFALLNLTFPPQFRVPEC